MAVAKKSVNSIEQFEKEIAQLQAKLAKAVEKQAGDAGKAAVKTSKNLEKTKSTLASVVKKMAAARVKAKKSPAAKGQLVKASAAVSAATAANDPQITPT